MQQVLRAVREWAGIQTKGRDKSHSVEHFARVEKFIKMITDDKEIDKELNSIESVELEVDLNQNDRPSIKSD